MFRFTEPSTGKFLKIQYWYMQRVLAHSLHVPVLYFEKFA